MANNTIDTIVVAVYFLIIFIVGYFLSKKYRLSSTEEFITGGRHLKWWQTGLTLVAMVIDPGIMGLAGLSFIYGFYVIQWNAVNIWITPWFAALFFIPVYWRSKIVTTPEYLEKRFNVQTRAFFSVIMVSMLVATMGYAVYMGSLLLHTLLGWPIYLNAALIVFVAGFYVIYGGLRAMLAMDVFQAIFLLLTISAVGITGIVVLGGFDGIFAIEELGKSGRPLDSILPPVDWDITTETFMPLPAVFTWAVIASMAFFVCNFSIAQRLLASKDEKHAQKAMIFNCVCNVFVLIFAYIAGVAMRVKMPDIVPDESFMQIIFTYFPVGIRGVLIAGLMAALLSTIDGLISSSSSLITQDIYLRFIKPKATGKALKTFVRILQVIIIAQVFWIVPIFIGDESSLEKVQNYYGNVLGLMIALFFLGVFSIRTKPWAAFWAMLFSLCLSFFLDYKTEINFQYIGTISFVVTLFLGIILSTFLGRSKSRAELENLTIWTLPDVKGPYVGFKSWKQLWYWAVILPVSWALICWLWEMNV